MKEKMKNCFKPHAFGNCQSAALLFLRLVVGIAFMYHGWGKIQAPFSWMPPDAGIPGFFQFLAAISEFGGGIALVLGLLIPLAMLGLGFTMAVATSMHAFVMKDPFVNPTGGSSYELALVFLAIAVLIGVMGPGKYSVDAKIFGQRP